MDVNNLLRQEIQEFEDREYAPKKKDLDKKCDLSLNINPLGASPKTVSRLKEFDSRKLSHYYPENMELLSEIASYVNLNTNQIMLGDGCDGCLQMIASTFIDKGDEVIIPTPTFHRYEFHAKIMGGEPIFVPMENFELNPEHIFNKVTEKTKILFLCNPNNPTGIGISKGVKEEVIKNFKGIVVVDEALADATGINGASLLEKYDNLIVARSFSKTFGLASLRIGYILSNPKIIEQIKKTSSPFRVNGVAQELSIESLRDKEHINKSKEYIDKNREFLISNLNKMGLKCTKSITANFLVDISKISNDSTEFVKQFKEKGVLVTDAKVFRLSKNTFVRVSVASEEENKKFIEILSEKLNNL